MAAQLIMLSRWDARTEPLVDPMAGSGTIPIEAAGLAVGAAIRNPLDLPLRHLAAFRVCRTRRPTSSQDRGPHSRARRRRRRIPAMVGNLRAAALTGASHENSIVIAQQDVRMLTPEYIQRMLPAARDMKPGVFCFNPPYGVRMARSKAKRSCSRSTPTWAAPSPGSVVGARRASSRTRGSCTPLVTLHHDETREQRRSPRDSLGFSCNPTWIPARSTVRRLSEPIPNEMPPVTLACSAHSRQAGVHTHYHQ